MLRKFSAIISSNIFLHIFSFFFCEPYKVNVGEFNIVWVWWLCGTGAAWGDIPHARSEKPRKMVGAGAVVRRYPTSKGKRRSPRKMVAGANSHLESNPITARDSQRAQTNLVHIRTQRPHRDWDKTVFEHLLQRYGSAMDCHRGRGSECSRHGYGISPLGRGHH